MKTENSGLQKLISSFGYACRGIYVFIQSEQNAKIHLLAAICAITAGFVLKISASEWCFIIFAIALVFVAEAINTAVEKLANQMSTEYNENIKMIKDVAAGAVLVCAIAALIIGLIIFLPKF
jgi:diacylglycerol kinase (ATP)